MLEQESVTGKPCSACCPPHLPAKMWLCLRVAILLLFCQNLLAAIMFLLLPLLVLPLTCRLPRLPRMCLPADSQLGLLEGLIASGEQLGLAIEQVDILKANVEASRLFLLFSEAVCMAACGFMVRVGCCLLPAAVGCLLPLLQLFKGCCLLSARLTLQALLWARKVRALLAQLPPGNSQQAPAQEQSLPQQEQQQPEAAATAAAEQQEQPQAEASSAAAEAAAVAEVQEQLLSAVEAAEGKAAAAGLAWEKRPPLSGALYVPAGCLPAGVTATAASELHPFRCASP